MIILYPKFKSEKQEIQVMPNGGYLLVYGLKIDSTKIGKFSIKSIFKTLKPKQNNEKKDGNDIAKLKDKNIIRIFAICRSFSVYVSL